MSSSVPQFWGRDNREHDVFLCDLINANGIKICVSNYGALIKNIIVERNQLKPIDIVLNYPSLKQYLNDEHYIGAVCGPYCNRIANGQVRLNNTIYSLDKNDQGHTLHSGKWGIHKRTWSIKALTTNSVSFSLILNEQEIGLPGRINLQVDYLLSDENRLHFSWSAYSTKDTVISLTNHSYFNLAGKGKILNHYLSINCQNYTPLDKDGIPTGTIASVENTKFNYQQGLYLESALSQLSSELQLFKGLDHNWTLDGRDMTNKRQHKKTEKITRVAELSCPDSALKLTVDTTLPSLQCYTGNHLASSGVFQQYQGVCLETQHSPNSPNIPVFSSPLLLADEVMQHETIYSFDEI